MHCHNCGTQIPDGTKFCAQCGTKVYVDESSISNDESEVVPADVTECVTDESSEVPIIESADDEAIEDKPAAEQVKKKQALPTKTRWMIFAAVAVVALAVGFVSPAVAVFTDEKSALSGKLDTASLDENTSSKASSAAASSSDANSDSSKGTKGSSASSNSSSKSSSSSASTSSNSIGSEDEDYLLPNIATEIYTLAELDTLSNYELYLARNEIFARHGRGFKNADLVDYFNSKDWYTQKYSPTEFDAMPSPLNSIERENLDTIRALEAQRNSEYAA